MTAAPHPAGPQLPITLYFCVGDSRSVELDSHGVITFSVSGNRWYGKISAAQREQLDDLLLSDLYAEALEQLEPGPGGPLMCYGDPYALLTHTSRNSSYTIQLSDIESIPRPVWHLITLVDQFGQTAFGALYKPVEPDLVGATPNTDLQLTFRPVASHPAPAAGEA